MSLRKSTQEQSPTGEVCGHSAPGLLASCGALSPGCDPAGLKLASPHFQKRAHEEEETQKDKGSYYPVKRRLRHCARRFWWLLLVVNVTTVQVTAPREEDTGRGQARRRAATGDMDISIWGPERSAGVSLSARASPVAHFQPPPCLCVTGGDSTCRAAFPLPAHRLLGFQSHWLVAVNSCQAISCFWGAVLLARKCG